MDESSVDVDSKWEEGRERREGKNLMSTILRAGGHVPLVASLALSLACSPASLLRPPDRRKGKEGRQGEGESDRQFRSPSLARGDKGGEGERES